MSLRTRSVIPILVGFIAAVSLYDTWLIVVFRETIGGMEKNPLGQWLLHAGAGDVEIFVRAKLAGTLTVVVILTFMYRSRNSSTVPVTTSLAALQTGVLAYLTFA